MHIHIERIPAGSTQTTNEYKWAMCLVSCLLRSRSPLDLQKFLLELVPLMTQLNIVCLSTAMLICTTNKTEMTKCLSECEATWNGNVEITKCPKLEC